MISFALLSDNNSAELSERLSGGRADFKSQISEIIDSFSEFLSDECEFSFASFENFLLVKIWDGEMYAFVYPIALMDGVCEKDALLAIGEYAVREEIPLVFCDVPHCCIEMLEDCFRFTESFADEDGYTVSVISEISRCDEIPTVTDGVLILSPLCEEDIPEYARLCRDADLNKYWGYDFREDSPDAPDEYFYNTAVCAAKDGVALSLAVKYDGRFIGEAVLWGFDLRGGAKPAFRILPEFQRKGFGGRTLALILRLGDEIGLTELCASVRCENTPSVKLLDRYMVCCHKGENVKRYLHKY